MRLSDLPGPPEIRTLLTDDGVRLRYFDTGEEGPGDPGATPIVLANGLGGPIAALQRPMQRLARARRVLSWDYRGLYGSGARGPLDVSVAAHARDLAAILRHSGIPRAAVLGWSMGAQVGLEFARSAPEQLAGLVLLNGAAGRPLAGVLVPGAERFVPKVLALLAANLRFSEAALRLATGTVGLEQALKTVGWIQREFPSGDFQRFLADFRTLDLGRYFELFRALIEHDAHDVLPHVRAPTLVLASERDFITPPRRARQLARQIPGARFLTIPGASHYAAAEAPDFVVERVSAFLRENVDAKTLALSPAKDHGYDATGARDSSV